MNKKKLFLGIDTSNYTTSIALCDEDGEVLLNLKKLLPVKEGERGLRQSDALKKSAYHNGAAWSSPQSQSRL